MRRLLWVLGLAAFGLGYCVPAEASIIKYVYEGEVTSVIGSPFNIYANPGDPVRGQFTFDTGAPDTNGSGSRGDYLVTEPGGLTVEIQGISMRDSGGQHRITVFDGLPGTGDYLSFINHNRLTVDGIHGPQYAAILLTFTDSTNMAFSNDDLPLPFDFGAYNGAGGKIDFFNGSEVINFQINSVHAAAVPEPSSWIVFAIIPLAVGACRWRRRRSRVR